MAPGLANHSRLEGIALSVFERTFARMRGLDDLAHALMIWGQPLQLTRMITRSQGWHQVLATRGSDAFSLVVTVSCGGLIAFVDLHDALPAEDALEDAFERWHHEAGRPDGQRPSAGCRFGTH